MKKTIQMLLRCGIMLVALVIPLRCLTDLMERDKSDVKYQPFFKQKEDFDVLFMGSSHVINGIFPMELWKDYGIVSYNFGGHASQLATTYWVMENAMDYTSPELIVIDCYGLSEEWKTPSQYSYIHQSFDAFPLSMKKIAAVFDLLNDPAMDEAIKNRLVRVNEKRTPLGMLWNFSVYHVGWAAGSKSWFVLSPNREKGAETRAGVEVPNAVITLPREDKLQADTVSVEYLERMIEDCQRRQIDVLLIYLPFPAAEDQWREANRAYEIAEKYGINYINFLEMDVVDFATDAYDTDSHLNASGARKVTDYLGRYITEHYDIPDQRDNPRYESWHEDYADYQAFKEGKLRAQKELGAYLTLLTDKNVDVLIEVDDPALWKDPLYVNLVANLGVDVSQLEGGRGFIVIDGSERAAQCLPCDPSSECVYDTILGELRAEYGESGEHEVSLGEQRYIKASEDDGAGLRICVLNGENGKAIHYAAFSFAMQERLGKYTLSEPVRL